MLEAFSKFPRENLVYEENFVASKASIHVGVVSWPDVVLTSLLKTAADVRCKLQQNKRNQRMHRSLCEPNVSSCTCHFVSFYSPEVYMYRSRCTAEVQEYETSRQIQNKCKRNFENVFIFSCFAIIFQK